MQGYQSLGTVLCETGLRMDGALSALGALLVGLGVLVCPAQSLAR